MGVLPGETWSRLARRGVARSFAPGEVILHQGEQADQVILTLDGRVKISRIDARGGTRTLAVLGPGELIGGPAVLNPNHRRSASVTAIDPCEVRFFLVGDFTTVTTALGLHTLIVEHVVGRLQDAEDARVKMAGLPAAQRLARCLLVFAVPRTEGALRAVGRPDRIDVALDADELAQLTGVARPVVADELRALREDGIVQMTRDRVVIVDVARLRARINPA